VGVDLRGPGEAAASSGRRWEQRIPYRLVDGRTRVELLKPGQGWVRDDDPGSAWVQLDDVDDPVHID
jgi:hypothetical protein